MHERNPYSKNKPDFAALGARNPFLAPYVVIGRNGRGHIDFKNKSALRALARVLLMEDFGLDVIFPEQALVPTVALRLNYILWIEDLFNCTTERLKGLDIGTGASAIYMLLSAKKNGWEMVGTDINPESIHFANRNIQKNDLQELVKVKLLEDDSIFESVLTEESSGFDFTICNPPFFACESDTDSNTKARRPDRPPPSAAKTGSLTELMVPGGEEQFVSKMIQESKEYADKVRIFTTMIGIKRHLKGLEDQIKAVGAEASVVTEFVQGKTMRWGLAWTFQKAYASNLAPRTKSSTPVEAILNCPGPLEALVSFLKDCMYGLDFKFIRSGKDNFEVVGEKNTWSHQRRRRREKKLESNKILETPEAPGGEDTEPPGKIARKSLPDSELKASAHETCKNSEPVMRSSDAKVSDDKKAPSKLPAVMDLKGEGVNTALHFSAHFKTIEENCCAQVLLCFKGGYLGKDGMNQVLQYWKNALDKHQF